MDIGRAKNSSIEKTTCSECNGWGGTCRSGTVLLVDDTPRVLQERKHDGLSYVS